MAKSIKFQKQHFTQYQLLPSERFCALEIGTELLRALNLTISEKNSDQFVQVICTLTRKVISHILVSTITPGFFTLSYRFMISELILIFILPNLLGHLQTLINKSLYTRSSFLGCFSCFFYFSRSLTSST